MSRVFISFHSSRQAERDRLVGYLEAEGHDVWHMGRDINSGESWDVEIIRGIAWCTNLVLIFSAEADASRHVHREIGLADDEGKPLHWLRVEPSTPVTLGYFLRDHNPIEWPDTAAPPAKLLSDLADGRIREEVSVQLSSHPYPNADDSLETMSLFVDRLPERDALRRSLESHVREMTLGRTSSVNNNLLTFFGVGGQGKSRLSRRLERWIAGRLPADDHWGAPPRTAHTVRWNLDDGRLPLIGFLLAFRTALARTGVRFDAFDLATAALYAVTLGRLGEDVSVRSHQAGLLEVLRQQGHRLAMSSLPTGVTTQDVRRVLAAARQQHSTDYSDLVVLGEVIALIQERGFEAESAPQVAAGMMDLVTTVLESFPPERRPLLALFIDTFEKVQKPDGRIAEQVINAMVVHLPLCLFVVTGREHLTWHETGSQHVRWFGPERWPSLSRLGQGEDEPRQHRLDRLSLADTRTTLSHALDAVGWPLSHAELSELAAETQGWPLRVEIVINLIHERREQGGTLTYHDLKGTFPALVRRLLEHLPDDVQLALQAATVVPTFDAAALRACDSAVKAGSVTRLLRTSLVGRSDDPFFPYRIHEELRHAICEAGADVEGGWDDEDRRAAAARLIASLEGRWGAAKAAGSHGEMMHVHAAAVRLSLEYGLETEWVKEAFGDTPSPGYQRDLLPNVDRAAPDSELLGLVQVNRCIGVQHRERRLAMLRSVSEAAVSDRVRFRADLWALYTLRNLGRFGEARELGERLVAEPYDRHCDGWRKPEGLIREQHAVTLSGGLWWQDLAEFEPDRDRPCWAKIRYAHGEFERASEDSRKRLERHMSQGKSYRFQMELQSTYVWTRLMAGGGLAAPELEGLAQHAKAYQPVWLMSTLLSWVGPWVVAEGHASAAHLWRQFDELVHLSGQSYRLKRARFAISIAELTGDLAWAREVRADFQDPANRWRSGIHFDFLFDHIGLPVPPAPVQWLDDVDLVRARWIDGWRRTLQPPDGWTYSDELYGWMAA